jgi:hypothetical protein
MSVIPNKQRHRPRLSTGIAWHHLEHGGVEVTLVHATRGNLRLTSITDRDGTLNAQSSLRLIGLCTRREHDGRFTYRGKVAAREGVPTRFFFGLIGFVRKSRRLDIVSMSVGPTSIIINKKCTFCQL